jgi:hypothetical protein
MRLLAYFYRETITQVQRHSKKSISAGLGGDFFVGKDADSAEASFSKADEIGLDVGRFT